MPSKYVVMGVSGEEKTFVGEYSNVVELALATWELGLTRPDFEKIEVSTQYDPNTLVCML